MSAIRISSSPDLVARIIGLMEERNVSKAELASLVGQHRSQVTTWLKKEGGYTDQSLERIARALHTTVLWLREERGPRDDFTAPPADAMEQEAQRDRDRSDEDELRARRRRR